MVFEYESPDLRLGEWERFGLPKTPEQEVLIDVGTELQHGLANHVAQTDFTANMVPSVLKTHLAQAGPGVVRRTLVREARMAEYQTPLFTEQVRRSIGETALNQSGALLADEVVLGPRTITHLQEQVDDLPYDFGELEAYHRIWRDAGALELLADVHWLATQSEQDPLWADRAYDVLTDATWRPEHYALPPDKPESLLLLCYVPDDSRQLLRRFMRHTMALDITRQNLAENPDVNETDRQLLAALGRYYEADVLHGSQWNNQTLSDSTRVEVALASAEGLRALADIQTITRAGGGVATIDAFHAANNQIWQAVRAAGNGTPLKPWQGSDYGHTLGLYGYDGLEFALHPESALQEFAQPLKDGRLAAILEDDPDQLAAWVRTVDAHTLFTTQDALCSVDVQTIARAALPAPGSEGFVGLFLLDVQNDQDQAAGIHAAEQVIGTRLQQVQGMLERNEPIQRTKIIIWSASTAAVGVANEWLKSITQQVRQEHADPDALWRHNGNGWSGAAISCEVRLKGWREEADVPYGV